MSESWKRLSVNFFQDVKEFLTESAGKFDYGGPAFQLQMQQQLFCDKFKKQLLTCGSSYLMTLRSMGYRLFCLEEYNECILLNLLLAQLYERNSNHYEAIVSIDGCCKNIVDCMTKLYFSGKGDDDRLQELVKWLDWLRTSLHKFELAPTKLRVDMEATCFCCTADICDLIGAKDDLMRTLKSSLEFFFENYDLGVPDEPYTTFYYNMTVWWGDLNPVVPAVSSTPTSNPCNSIVSENKLEKNDPEKAELQNAEPEKADPEKAEPQEAVPKKAGPQNVAPEKAELEKTDPEKADLEKAEPQNAEPEKADPEKVEPQEAVPKKAGPQNVASQKADPEKGDSKNSDGNDK